MQTREVRTSLRQAREARARPETIVEAEEEGDAPYTSFTGSPSGAWGMSESGPEGVNVGNMEATVAGLVFDSRADHITPGVSNLTDWINFPDSVPENAVKIAKGNLVFDATLAQVKTMIDRGGISDKTHKTLIAVQSGMSNATMQFGLRADSEGAPETLSLIHI